MVGEKVQTDFVGSRHQANEMLELGMNYSRLHGREALLVMMHDKRAVKRLVIVVTDSAGHEKHLLENLQDGLSMVAKISS